MNAAHASSRSSRSRGRAGQRRGSLYFIVLGICLLVSIIGTGAIMATRVQTRSVAQTADYDSARLYARSAIELGTYLANQANFRTNYSNGAWVTNQRIGDGTLTIQGTNPNGALNNVDTDPVNLTGYGYKGMAIHKSQVTLIAKPVALNCLNGCATFGGGVSLGGLLSGPSYSFDQPLSTNGDFTALTSTVNGQVQYSGLLSLGLLTGGSYTTKWITPLTLPAGTVFDYYKSHATSIPLSSLPTSNGCYCVQNCLLSPANNPFGSGTNAQGIYVIDGGSLGASFDITNCRIVGTLVLLNAAGNSRVEGAVNWSPAISNYPCLMVQSTLGANFTLQYDTAVLSESSIGANLNPSTTPYNGVSNSTMTDSYPSVINGLIYCSGNLVTATKHSVVKGVIVCAGSLSSSSGTVDLTYDSTYANNPPPGFYQTPVRMVVSGSTWAQGVN